MSSIKSMAEQQEEKVRQEKINKEIEKEERRKKIVPIIALVGANIIFLSLDVRAYQVVHTMTNSHLLAAVTVIIAGGLALLWFDILYPHAKRHSNEGQEKLSIWATALAILLSAILAFMDYVVGVGDNYSRQWESLFWMALVGLTVFQGFALARYFMIDKYIEVIAKRQKAHAEKVDGKDEISVLKSKLSDMKDILSEMEELEKTYKKEDIEAVAKILGVVIPKSPNS